MLIFNETTIGEEDTILWHCLAWWAWKPGNYLGSGTGIVFVVLREAYLRIYTQQTKIKKNMKKTRPARRAITLLRIEWRSFLFSPRFRLVHHLYATQQGGDPRRFCSRYEFNLNLISRSHSWWWGERRGIISTRYYTRTRKVYILGIKKDLPARSLLLL